MTTFNKVALVGCAVAVTGFLVCIYFYYFTPVYSGASGAGMAGLGSGLAILAGMIALAFGSVLAVISFLIGIIRTSRVRRRQ